MQYTLKKICDRCKFTIKEPWQEKAFLDVCNYILNNPSSNKSPRCPECKFPLRIVVAKGTKHKDGGPNGHKKN